MGDYHDHRRHVQHRGRRDSGSSSDSGSHSDASRASSDADALAGQMKTASLRDSEGLPEHATRYADQDFEVDPRDSRVHPTEGGGAALHSSKYPRDQVAEHTAHREQRRPTDQPHHASVPPSAQSDRLPGQLSQAFALRPGEQGRFEDRDQPYPLAHKHCSQQLSGSIGQPGSIPPADSSHILGPFLRFSTVNLDEGKNGVWYGSILVVSPTNMPAPSLELLSKSNGADDTSLPTDKPLPLDAHRDQTFWKLELRIPILADHDQLVTARLSLGGRINSECQFLVAGRRTPLRVVFYSCNGVSADVKDQGIIKASDLLWDDVFERHSIAPFHYMIGGGDQLYCDPVWVNVPACKQWLAKSVEDRIDSAYEGDDVKEIEDFYFNMYKEVFGNGRYAQALRSIPSMMVIDDHDIFDGVGTYPDNFRTSRFMSGVASTGYKFYLLFQQHTTPIFAKVQGFFGHDGATHYIAQLNQDLAMVGHDGRKERQINQISHPMSYDMMEQRLQSDIAPSTKHVLVATGVPILYPRLNIAENALHTLANINNRLSAFALFQKANAFQSIMSPLANQPDLLDDLGDHWTAPPHETERLRVIEMFQKFAASRSIRVTFVAGDVHCCGTGRFKGTSPENLENIRKDPYFMLQIISSGIQNSPPPQVVINALHQSAQLIDVNMHSNEAMIDLFGRDAQDNKSLNGRHKLLARRNWTSIHQDADGGLRFKIRVEGGNWGSGKIGSVYGVVAPPLMV